tara:strand:+ start:327 stop:605 length:279 start_codon:yes stop_codon:yes gene_type:complete
MRQVIKKEIMNEMRTTKHTNFKYIYRLHYVMQIFDVGMSISKHERKFRDYAVQGGAEPLGGWYYTPINKLSKQWDKAVSYFADELKSPTDET